MFDSGVGGLTVLHECLVSLPEEDFLYLGDTARFPYGERSPDELLRFARQLAAVLIERGAKLLVVACNSATAAALPALREELHGRTPVIGVVTPEARLAARATRNGRVGLIATPATVASGAYADAIAAIDPHVDLVAVPCPDLAPLIQDPPHRGGDHDPVFTDELLQAVRGYTAPLVEAGVDTVILGCTHYPLVRPMLQRMLGRGVTIVTSGAALARQVEHALGSRDLATRRGGEGTYSFLCTGDVGAFRALGTRFLQMPLTEVERVELAPQPTTEVPAWPRP